MENINVLEIIAKIFAFIWPKYSQGEADNGPKMHGIVFAAKVVPDIVNLGMTVVATCDAVISTSCSNLIKFEFPIGSSLLWVP